MSDKKKKKEKAQGQDEEGVQGGLTGLLDQHLLGNQGVLAQLEAQGTKMMEAARDTQYGDYQQHANGELAEVQDTRELDPTYNRGRPKAQPLSRDAHDKIAGALLRMSSRAERARDESYGMKRGPLDAARHLHALRKQGRILSDVNGWEGGGRPRTKGVTAETRRDGSSRLIGRSAKLADNTSLGGNIYFNESDKYCFPDEAQIAAWESQAEKRKRPLMRRESDSDESYARKEDARKDTLRTAEAWADPRIRDIWLESVLAHEYQHTQQAVVIGNKEKDAYKHHIRYLRMVQKQRADDPDLAEKINVLIEKAQADSGADVHRH